MPRGPFRCDAAHLVVRSPWANKINPPLYRGEGVVIENIKNPPYRGRQLLSSREVAALWPALPCVVLWFYGADGSGSGSGRTCNLFICKSTLEEKTF